MKIEIKGGIASYMALPYTVILKRDEDGDFVSRVAELSGCVAHGETEQEALDSLREVQEMWIADRIERKLDIPLPMSEEEGDLPSGKWLQRVPRSLHRSLIRAAKKEGVSLNTLATTLLADGLTKKLFGDVLIAQTPSFTFCDRTFLPSGDWFTINSGWRGFEPAAFSPGVIVSAQKLIPKMIPVKRSTANAESNKEATELASAHIR